ncbi:MAG: hypothetical protein ACI835_005079 [Planctomycetota bacterium]|jgi:hypothetical protein
MRVFVGIGLLASLFWMASTWQARQTDRIRRERDQQHGPLVAKAKATLDLNGNTLAGGTWSTLVLGRPSGVTPIAHIPRERGGTSEAGVRTARRERQKSGREQNKQPAGWLSDADRDSRATRANDGQGSGSDGTQTRPTKSPALPYKVRRGDSLSVICGDYYGTERGPYSNLAQLTTGVAKYNGMNPDQLTSGQTILLPALSELKSN